jgi:hypothetical protein
MVFRQFYSPEGLKTKELHVEKKEFKVGSRRKIEFFDNTLKNRVKDVEFALLKKGEKLIDPSRFKLPLTITHFDERGFKESEERFVKEGSKMGSNINYGEGYTLFFVPEIQYQYNADGALKAQYLVGYDGRFFEVPRDSLKARWSFEFPNYYTSEVNAIKYEYFASGGKSTYYYHSVGDDFDHRNLPPHRSKKTIIYRKNSNDILIQRISTNSDFKGNMLPLEVDGDVIKEEISFDELGRRKEIKYFYQRGTERFTLYDYDKETYSFPLYSSESHFSASEGNVNVMGGDYHAKRFKRDERGRIIWERFYDTDDKLIENPRGFGEAYVKYTYNDFNHIIEELFYDI